MITLMYHGITSKDLQIPSGRETGAELYDVGVENFRAQMQWLKSSKIEAGITFDDGEMNNYKLAFPIIKEMGFHGYFFIIVKRIGQNGYMGWEELKSLGKEGMVIGSHGFSHEILTQLKDNEVIEELKVSKDYLEKNLGFPINSFSVPRGFYNDKIIEMAYQVGYTKIFVSEKLKGSKSICLPRIAVKANWSLKRFQQALENQVPTREIMGDAIKRAAKFILREPGYNYLRGKLIYISK